MWKIEIIYKGCKCSAREGCKNSCKVDVKPGTVIKTYESVLPHIGFLRRLEESAIATRVT